MTPRVDVLRICGTKSMMKSEKIGLLFGQKKKKFKWREPTRRQPKKKRDTGDWGEEWRRVSTLIGTREPTKNLWKFHSLRECNWFLLVPTLWRKFFDVKTALKICNFPSVHLDGETVQNNQNHSLQEKLLSKRYSRKNRGDALEICRFQTIFVWGPTITRFEPLAGWCSEGSAIVVNRQWLRDWSIIFFKKDNKACQILDEEETPNKECFWNSKTTICSTKVIFVLECVLLLKT